VGCKERCVREGREVIEARSCTSFACVGENTHNGNGGKLYTNMS
jgi:hypothetical protein